MWRRSALIGALVLGTLAPTAAVHAATDEEIREAADRLVCYCGTCSGLTAGECTCGTAAGIRERISAQLDAGLTPDQVVAAWVEERGEQVLAVPTRSGFNLVGWIMPFAVTLVATAVVLLILMRWRRQSLLRPQPDEPLSEADRRYLDRIERDVRTLQG